MPTRILVMLGFLVAVSMTFVALLILTDHAKDNETLITMVLGFASLIIVQLVTGTRVERKVDRVLNGEMEGKVERSLHKVLDETGLATNGD